jgi:uncharacterized OB-fold protein
MSQKYKGLQRYCAKCGALFAYATKCPYCGAPTIKKSEMGKGLMEYATFLNKQYAEKLNANEEVSGG